MYKKDKMKYNISEISQIMQTDKRGFWCHTKQFQCCHYFFHCWYFVMGLFITLLASFL